MCVVCIQKYFPLTTLALGRPSEFLIWALRSQGIHELRQADPSVQFVPVEASQETLQFYLAGLLIAGGLLAELCSFIEVAFEVTSELT